MYHFPGRSIDDVEAGLKKLGLEQNIIRSKPTAVSSHLVEELKGIKNSAKFLSAKSKQKVNKIELDECNLIRIDLSVIDVDEEDEGY